MKLTLSRHSYHPYATMGWLHVAGERFATLEPPWRENRRNMSCIPEGTYPLVPRKSVSRGDVWEVEQVPGRGDILIHVGNRAEDTEGCILVGLDLSPSMLAVLRSKAAIERLHELLDGKQRMTLTVDFKR